MNICKRMYLSLKGTCLWLNTINCLLNKITISCRRVGDSNSNRSGQQPLLFLLMWILPIIFFLTSCTSDSCYNTDLIRQDTVFQEEGIFQLSKLQIDDYETELVSKSGLRSDINNDFKVDLLDFLILSEEWLMSDNYLQFDGSTGYVTVPDNAALNLGTGDFSICFWIKTSETTGCVLDKTKTGPGEHVFRIFLNEGGIDCQFGALGSQDFAVAINNGSWHFVVYSIDRNGNKILYVDGTAYSAVITSVGVESFSGVLLEISRKKDNNEHFNGSLDDLRIYKSVLTSDEVATIYNGGKGKKYERSDVADITVPDQLKAEGTGDGNYSVDGFISQSLNTLTMGVFVGDTLTVTGNSAGDYTIASLSEGPAFTRVGVTPNFAGLEVNIDWSISGDVDAPACSAAWNMDEGEGSAITDEISSLEGTITDGVEWQGGGVPFGSDAGEATTYDWGNWF